MISVAEALSEIQAAGKAFPVVDAVVVKENQLTENKEHQEPNSLMAEGAEQNVCLRTETRDELLKKVARLNLEIKTLEAGQRIQEGEVSVTGSLPDDLPVRECRQIRDHLIFLKDELVPEHIISYLFSNRVLNDEQREDLMEVLDNQGGRRCTDSLLTILLHECSDSRAYDQFCQCLLKGRYIHALKKLEPNWPDITDEQLQKSRGKLPDEEYSLIQDHMVVLTTELLPTGYIRHLFSKDILTEEDCDQLKSIRGKMACVEAMLFILLRCGKFGFKQFLKHLKDENPSVFKILYPEDEQFELFVKYKDENHEIVSDTGSVRYLEFTDRATGNVEELLSRSMVKMLHVKKGCVEITFEVHSLVKADKEKLQAVVENAMESEYIGTDAISKIELKPMDDDKLTDEEIEKEIKMFEAEIVRLNKERQRLLEIERTEGEKLISFLTTSKEYNRSLQRVIRNRRAIVGTLATESEELKKEALALSYVRVASAASVVGGIVGAFFTLGLSLGIAAAGVAGGAVAIAGTTFLQKVLERTKVKEVDRMFEKDNLFQPGLANLEKMFYIKYNSIVLVRFREIIIKIFQGSKELAQIIAENDRKSRELLGLDSTHDVRGYVFLNMPLLNSIKEILNLFTITTESKLAETFLQLAEDIEQNLKRADILARELTPLDDELSRLTYVNI